MIRAGIIGGAGYTAGELVRLLVNHPAAEIAWIHSESQAGKPVAEHHPGLVGDTDLVFTDVVDLEGIDVLFLCQAHGKSRAFWEEHPCPAGLKVVDLAQDFRDESDGYVYGLPELNRNRILGAQLYKFDIEGFLHWGYNFYGTQYSDGQMDPYAVTDGNAFSPAGDCFQVYPGEDGRPEESIRMMVTHHALQDLRAMQWLEKLAGREKVLEIIDVGPAEPVTFTRYPREAEYLIRLRERINQEILSAAEKG